MNAPRTHAKRLGKVARGKKPPKRTLSSAELEQRRKASLSARLVATGPRTEQGKAIVSRNAMVHGRYSAVHQKSFGLGAASISKMFIKPCLTTCPVHPDNPDRTEAPCSLVIDGLTSAGGSCLDKTQYVNAFDCLLKAMTNGDMEGMQGLLASEQAANFEILSRIREAIAKHEPVIMIPAITKDGEVVYDKHGNMVPAKWINNPAFGPYIALLDAMGINLAELMATPKAVQQKKEDDTGVGALQSLIGAMAQRLHPRLGQDRDA